MDIRHDLHGFYLCTDNEAAFEDMGNPSVGFDGRPHFPSIDDAAAALQYEEAETESNVVDFLERAGRALRPLPGGMEGTVYDPHGNRIGTAYTAHVRGNPHPNRVCVLCCGVVLAVRWWQFVIA
jgi:hypothetical protein